MHLQCRWLQRDFGRFLIGDFPSTSSYPVLHFHRLSCHILDWKSDIVEKYGTIITNVNQFGEELGCRLFFCCGTFFANK